MKPPVEHVKVSARGKKTLIKVKGCTGLEHWNTICRIALCRSLADPAPPPKVDKTIDNSIDMDWKTFAGQLQEELTALTLLRAQKDGIDVTNKETLSEYFRAHLERGIGSLQNSNSLSMLCSIKKQAE
jgi:DNA sulfur modification protein DndE